MAVRSKCLVAPVAVPTALTLAYTVPAGETTLVKWVSAYNANAGAQLLTIYVDPGAPIRQLMQVIPPASTVQIQLWWVLQPGWMLKWTSSLAAAIAAGVYGTELEGVAD